MEPEAVKEETDKAEVVKEEVDKEEAEAIKEMIIYSNKGMDIKIQNIHIINEFVSFI